MKTLDSNNISSHRTKKGILGKKTPDNHNMTKRHKKFNDYKMKVTCI